MSEVEMADAFVVWHDEKMICRKRDMKIWKTESFARFSFFA